MKSEKKYNKQIKSLLTDDKICIRDFNKGYIWKRKKASYFIESLILGCEVHPLIMYQSNNKYFICDGLNRYLTIKRFVNNDLVLENNGLTKLKWLSGKRFKDLKKSEQNFFLHNIFISYIVYKHENKYDLYNQISVDEEILIQKQLYVRYNSGIKLAIEDLQKAQFEGEYLTEKFRKHLEKDEKFKNDLKKLYLGNRNKKRNEIYCILVDIRYLIASTYADIKQYCLCKDKNQRINIFYEDKLCQKSDEEKENIFNDFMICIELLSKMLDMPEWIKYKELHNKYFIQALYWAISVIRSKRIYQISKIDLKSLIEYFGKNEKEYMKFSADGAHRRKPMIERYSEMDKYFKNYYSLNLTYEEPNKNEDENTQYEGSKIDVQNVYYKRLPIEITFNEMLDNLRNFRYNIKPSYQRLESLNIEASSRVVESMLSGIEIPPILTFQKTINGETVFEVIDGQQRLLSCIGYVNGTYKNERGEECHSEKEGYSLTGLDIYYELNDCTYELEKGHKLLNKKMRDRIGETTLYFVNMIKDNDKEARDHFVRLNSNSNILSNNFYYWNAIADKEVLDLIFKVVKNDYKNILGNDNVMLVSEQHVTALSYIFYQLKHNKNYIIRPNLSLLKVTNWLKNFNKIKQLCYDKDEEKISIQRKKYLNAVEETDQFLMKIDDWLKYVNNSIRDIFKIKSNSSIALKNLVCFVQLLDNISLDDMKKNSRELQKILSEFYTIIHSKEIDVKKQTEYLMLYKEKINILDSSIMNEVYEEFKHTVVV